MKFIVCAIALIASMALTASFSQTSSFRDVANSEAQSVFGGECKKRSELVCGRVADWPDGQYPKGCVQKKRHYIPDSEEEKGHYSTLNWSRRMCATKETSACGWNYILGRCLGSD